MFILINIYIKHKFSSTNVLKVKGDKQSLITITQNSFDIIKIEWHLKKLAYIFLHL